MSTCARHSIIRVTYKVFGSMRLSLYRPNLALWVGKHIHIDSYELRTPTVDTEVIGFIPPLQQVSYSGSSGQIRGYAHQSLFVSYLYLNTTLYNNLPIATLEGVHSTLSQLLLTQWHDIADLIELELMLVDTPITIRESGDSMGNWIVDLQWVFAITWLAEPEYVIDKPFTLTSLNTRLFDHKLTVPGLPTDYTTDRQLDVTYIEPPNSKK